MTPLEWKHVEQNLAHPWGDVTLQCDEYRLTIQVKQVSALKFVMQVYVNGSFSGAWMFPDKPCEEQRRFLRARYYRAMDSKHLAAVKKVYSKKQYEALAAKKLMIYTGQWGSFKALRAHLVKNNKVITLVSPAMPGAAEKEAP
jgi:hypothetical protein